MDIFLIRHAEAASRERFESDAARPLTAKGREDFRTVVAGLRRLDVHLDRILHSPLLRAVETAQLLATLLDRDGQTMVTERLASPPDTELLAEIEGRRVALVGHEPLLADLLAWLLTGTRDAGAPLAFKKGGVAWLTGEAVPGHASLVAFLPPSVTRQLGQEG